MSRWIASLLLVCCGLAVTNGDRYECDTAAYEAVEDISYDLDYDQRRQQTEIDDFVDQLDELLALAAGNNTCGSEEYHNVDSSDYSVLVGGCENDIYLGADYSAIGGGQNNWAFTDAKMVAINGGYHNIATGDWAAIGGGVKNKAYSNYATVLGGYLNKANAKFATVLGGSRNTVSGRYSTVMGMKTKVTGDYAAGLGFGGGTDCFVRGDHAFGVCANQFIISGSFGEFDLISELTSRRELSDIVDKVSDLEVENAELEKQVTDKIAALLQDSRVTNTLADSIKSLLSTL